MSKTQRIKIKRELLLLLEFLSTSYLTNSPKPLRFMHLSPFFMITYPLTKFFLSKMMRLVIDFFLECFSFLLILSLDIILVAP